MRVEFYDTKKRKKLLTQLNEQFGVTEIPKILFETGKEKVRGFSGDLTIDELYSLDKIANVEFMGQYLFRHELGYLRIGFDGTIFLKNQFSKNIAELNESQVLEWMNGKSLQMNLARGIYVVKCGDDFFGCGISDGNNLINFVPKERRIRRN